jgi:hypothetical protein
MPTEDQTAFYQEKSGAICRVLSSEELTGCDADHPIPDHLDSWLDGIHVRGWDSYQSTFPQFTRPEVLIYAVHEAV